MKTNTFASSLAAGALLAAVTAAPAGAETYTIDPVHSTIGFSVQHLVVSQTRGVFDDYRGTIVYDPDDLVASRINVVIQAASIDTRNGKRDEHLRGAEFFDVANHKTITFTSTNIRKSADGYEILGDLTIRGNTRPVVLSARINGPVDNPSGGTVLGLSARGTINRQDFGVSWNKQMDQGGWMISNEVTIEVEVEADAK